MIREDTIYLTICKCERHDEFASEQYIHEDKLGAWEVASTHVDDNPTGEFSIHEIDFKFHTEVDMTADFIAEFGEVPEEEHTPHPNREHRLGGFELGVGE